MLISTAGGRRSASLGCRGLLERGPGPALPFRSAVLQTVEVGLIEDIPRVAELARHGRKAVLAHVVQLVCREGAQNALDALARAAAPRLDGVGVIDPDAIFMKQAEQ